MYQPAKIPKSNRRVQQLSKLESEHQRNQNRIRQLHRRNRELEEEMRHLAPGRAFARNTSADQALSKPVKLKSGRPKSLRRIFREFVTNLEKKQVGRYSLLFWLQVSCMMIGVAIFSGIGGFLLTRMIASLVR